MLLLCQNTLIKIYKLLLLINEMFENYKYNNNINDCKWIKLLTNLQRAWYWIWTIKDEIKPHENGSMYNDAFKLKCNDYWFADYTLQCNPNVVIANICISTLLMAKMLDHTDFQFCGLFLYSSFWCVGL